MLNDFGCAVPARSKHLFAGTLRFAPTSVLQSYLDNPQSPIVSECWHDLESAVKLLWIVAFGYRHTPLFQIRGSDVKSLLEFWKRFEQGPFPDSLLKAAHAGDYDTLLLRVSYFTG